MPEIPGADPRPEPPEPLPDDACCGNGCDPCVFDFYQEEVAHYRAALRDWMARHAGGPAAPAPSGGAAAAPDCASSGESLPAHGPA